jgi:UTP-glucose-1-phosphate uridylyltransferase
LIKLLGHEGLNTLMIDADVYNCGNKLGFLSANLTVGIRDSESRANIPLLINKLLDDDFKHQIKLIISC